MKQDITNIRVIKTHEDAVLPTQKIGDVGFDLSSVEDIVAEPHKSVIIDIGLAYASDPIALGNPHDPIQLLGKIEGRSGLASKGLFAVGGIVDPSYRGTIKVCLFNGTDSPYEISKGDRVAQMVFYPVLARKENHHVEFVATEKQEISDRGDSGFGASGK